MPGLLPDHVLAPRTHRTGLSGRYLTRSLGRTQAAVIQATLDEPLILEALGIVNAEPA